MSILARNLTRYAQTQTRKASAISYTSFIQLQQTSRSKNCYSTEALEQRYQDKLLEKAKAKGYESVEQLKEQLKDDIETRKRDLNKIDPLKELEDYEQRIKMSQNNTKVTEARGPVDSSKATVPFKTLDSFLKLEKIQDLSKQEIEFLWRARWANLDKVLNAVVPAQVFAQMSKHIKAAPTFVLPLPREIVVDAAESKNDQGMELHYIQWQNAGRNTVHCIITSLAEYKLHKEYAKPHTTFQFHKELINDKQIVLMNGLVEKDVNISLQDAQLLLLNIQRFYGAMGEESVPSQQRIRLLHDFANGSSDFSVEKLISLAQSMDT
ncbi:LANO_0E04852g1_1 [Lachancea nothofagi CBS 11611]|uniref:LANO_0E04852g1_1 n=1 Tax=Lachancea nothofagi CBS 11611 TaxID=1266666 RepID=A0A1G4JSE9_9SACH|nr:LANO_0E04852g1_1 [Lachancea nothofagi CBS 11611]